nr:mediator of RNA polymerase II transcription subunit 7b-like [Physcomitrium patens]|eukprot:XP_024376673.1 mediator of RNA polymerase II transcription subunit 7b-like [Physcomitrella patens]
MERILDSTRGTHPRVPATSEIGDATLASPLGKLVTALVAGLNRQSRILQPRPNCAESSEWATTDILPGLEEEGLRQLYPTGSDVDYKKELRALNRELILQFLELIDALIERPSQSARCVEDITLILRNVHHLLNSLRPHQARATVIHMLEAQLIRRKEALAKIRRKRAEARAMLQEFSVTL